jgi:hypothetical protein
MPRSLTDYLVAQRRGTPPTSRGIEFDIVASLIMNQYYESPILVHLSFSSTLGAKKSYAQ